MSIWYYQGAHLHCVSCNVGMKNTVVATLEKIGYKLIKVEGK